MSEFERLRGSVRPVRVLYGDTIQRLAFRETGDAAEWPRLVELNGLRPPFLVEPGAGGPGLVEYGQTLLIPSGEDIRDDAEVGDFGTDVLLAGGELLVEDGDIVVVSGIENLRQAITHVIATDEGELIFHPEYGSRIRRVLGSSNGPVSTLLAAEYAKAAVLSDERVLAVPTATSEAAGDGIKVFLVAEAAGGETVSSQAVF